MGTIEAVQETAIRIVAPPQIVGPDSPYEKRRSELRTEYAPIIEKAKTLTAITSLEDAEQATSLGRLLHVAGSETTSFFKAIKDQLNALKQPILDAEKADGGPLEAEKQRLGALLTVWNEAERLRKEEAERIDRENAFKAAQEEQIARAIELESLGHTEQAVALFDEPVYTPAVIHQNSRPAKVSGQVGKKTYKAKVNDLKALVRAVAEGRAPILCIMANQQFLDEQARSYKEGFDFPGCELDKSTGTHFRK